MKNQQPDQFIWWKHGVVYHIYPRSFYDSNKDGIGDIRGIRSKLGYLSKLGVDAIWLSPVYVSPQVDFGYDISDHLNIDPLYGKLEDFRLLLKDAHDRNIKVIMDLVLNHTSDEHAWFKESSSSDKGPKRNWYIWRTGNKGAPPNNWKTAFGGSAWEYDKKSGQYYYHSFFKEQPDLNWRNKELKKEFFKVIDFWLNIGVDGFRLDVANFIIKDKKFRNNPGILKRWGKQESYTRNRPKSIKVLKEVRNLLDKYPEKVSIGEIFTLPPGDPETVSRYLDKGDNALHLAFDFSLIFTPWKAKKVGKTLQRWYDSIPAKGWPSLVLSNHDLSRVYNRNPLAFFKKQKAIVGTFLLLTAKGTPFIYYGDEISMRNARLSKRNIQDPLGLKYYPFYKGRDKSRTPMQWNSKKYSGFSKKKPWLPVNPDYKEVNVASQLKLKYSLLWYHIKLLKLRKNEKALHAGDHKVINPGKNGLLSYERSFAEDRIVVILNFSPFRAHQKLEPVNYRVLFSSHPHNFQVVTDGVLTLKPFEAIILKLEINQWPL